VTPDLINDVISSVGSVCQGLVKVAAIVPATSPRWVQPVMEPQRSTIDDRTTARRDPGLLDRPADDLGVSMVTLWADVHRAHVVRGTASVPAVLWIGDPHRARRQLCGRATQ
jgi:hypothetical protein